MTTPDAYGWLPIESAPKDANGTVLIAQKFGQRWTVSEAHYVARKRAWFSFGDYGDDEFSQPYRPTHWQPLPNPPVSEPSL